MKSALCLLITALVVVSIPGTARAQTAPPAPTAEPTSAAAAPDETVVLNPFTVSESSEEGYISHSATAIGRIAQPLEDIPQQVTIINSAMIEDLNILSFQDILSYDSSVDFSNDQFNGPFPLVRGFATPNVLRNGVPIGADASQGNILGLEAIEQVEVVKGAAAVLYGPSQPGGIVNYVTKSPLFHPENSVDATFFGQGGYKATVDSTGPIPIKSSDGRDILAYRFVATSEGRELYQINDQSVQRQVYYGALTFQPFTDLTIDASYEYDHQKAGFFNAQLLPQSTVTGLGNGSLSPSTAPLPYSLYPVDWTYDDDGTYIDEHDKYLQVDAVLRHDFGKFGIWTLRANYLWSETALFRQLDDITAGNYPQPVTAANIGEVVNFNQTVTAADVAAGRLWIPARYIRQLDGFPTLSLDTQWDLTGVVNTGPVKHTLLIGSEQNLGADFKSGIPGVASIEKQAYTGAAGDANAIWVDSPNLQPITNINWNGPLVTNTIKNATGVPYNDNLKFGVPWLTVPAGGNYDKDLYFFDAASLLNDRLQLSAGARLDEVGANVTNTEFTTRVWTFRFGAVYKILPQLHVYVLHNQSFVPNPTAASAAFGYYIPPSRGKQDEVGLRLFSTDRRFELDAALYEISTTNVVQSNPFGNVGVVPPIPANNYVFVPGESNTGIDLDAKFNVTRSTQLIATFSHYNIAEVGSPTAAGVYPEFAINNVPSDQLALWGKYAPPIAALRGLAFTLGDRYVGRRPAGAVGSAPAFYLNSYNAVDAGASYGRAHWTVNLLVHNVFNIYAIEDAPATNRLYPLEPREETLSLKYKF